MNDYGTKIRYDLDEGEEFKFLGYDGEILIFTVNAILKYSDGTLSGRDVDLEKINPKDILYQDINSMNEDIFKYDERAKYWTFVIKAKPNVLPYLQ